MFTFLIQRWFLLALAAVLAVGITYCEPLEPLSQWEWLRNGIVAGVMFWLTVPLETAVIWRSLRNPLPTLLAVAVTYGILPLVTWGVSLLLGGDLRAGLQVVAATPCSLASASVWTRRAGGNDALATLVTILTNGTCFVMTPLWLLIMTGTWAQNSELSLNHMMWQLTWLVLIPILAAQLVRRYTNLATWTANHKLTLSAISHGGILSMVLLGAIRTGLRLREQSGATHVLELLTMIAAVLSIHLSMFWVGVRLGRAARCSRADQIAIGFSGSQKTLMVGILMAMTLKVSILPMVAYHCLQLFADTVIADRYRREGAEVR